MRSDFVAPPPPTRPWHLIAAAVWWSIVAFILPVVVTLILFYVISIQLFFNNMFLSTVLLLALEIALLLVCWRQGKYVGGGNVAAGLGDLPVQRWRWVLGLMVIDFVISRGWEIFLYQLPALETGLQAVTKASGASFDGSVWVVPITVSGVILAPLSEELFFRGWLWTGLRRVWSPLPVSAITGGLWLALHFGNSALYPLAILPSAVTLSVIRHVGGSVRASILAHVVGNAVATVGAVLPAALHS